MRSFPEYATDIVYIDQPIGRDSNSTGNFSDLGKAGAPSAGVDAHFRIVARERKSTVVILEGHFAFSCVKAEVDNDRGHRVAASDFDLKIRRCPQLRCTVLLCGRSANDVQLQIDVAQQSSAHPTEQRQRNIELTTECHADDTV